MSKKILFIITGLIFIAYSGIHMNQKLPDSSIKVVEDEHPPRHIIISEDLLV
jgi:hypothetical protein